MKAKAKTRRIAGLIKEMYAIVEKLEQRFPGRRFTLDGHLVGSLEYARR